MLLIYECAIHQSRHQQGLCMRISVGEKPNAHALLSSIHLSSWYSLSICANERKSLSRPSALTGLRCSPLVTVFS